MARLRIRIELNRGGAGVPLRKLASVVDEAQKFFHMLGEDVRIDKGKGEWLGSEFDHESLNFTAEYVGPVTADQVQAFYAAFDGTTPLRRGTIAQFAHITDSIGEDELIGFGLYQSETEHDPTEWRCLSRRDALRIAGEIQVLAEAAGETGGELLQGTHLPAVASSAARMFSERRTITGHTQLDDLSKRMSRVETRIEEHSGQIRDLQSESAATEASFRNLLSAVESFCDQATQQIERVSLPGLPEPAPAPHTTPKNRWIALGLAAILGSVLVFSIARITGTRAAAPVEPKAAVVTSPAPPQPGAKPLPPPPPEPAPAPEVIKRPMRIDLEATEPTWVSVTAADGSKLLARLIDPAEAKTIELTDAATLRTGNAGGLVVRVDGKSVGPIGPKGKVREIEFKDGGFHIVASQD